MPHVLVGGAVYEGVARYDGMAKTIAEKVAETTPMAETEVDSMGQRRRLGYSVVNMRWNSLRWNRAILEKAGQLVSRSVSPHCQSVNRLVSQPIRSVTQSFGQSVSQPTSQSVSLKHATARSLGHSVACPFAHSLAH